MLPPNYGYARLTPDELRNLRAHYCAEAELVDRWGTCCRKSTTSTVAQFDSRLYYGPRYEPGRT